MTEASQAQGATDRPAAALHVPSQEEMDALDFRLHEQIADIGEMVEDLMTERDRYREALEKHLDVMDQAAFSLCQEKSLPIRVFNFTDLKNLERAAAGEEIGTLVHE